MEKGKVIGKRADQTTAIPSWGCGPHLRSFISEATIAVGENKKHGMADQRVKRRFHSAYRGSLHFPPFFFSLPHFSVLLLLALSPRQRCVHIIVSRISVFSISLSFLKCSLDAVLRLRSKFKVACDFRHMHCRKISVPKRNYNYVSAILQNTQSPNLMFRISKFISLLYLHVQLCWNSNWHFYDNEIIRILLFTCIMFLQMH